MTCGHADCRAVQSAPPVESEPAPEIKMIARKVANRSAATERPLNVLKAAKQRLKAVKVEIKRLRKLEREEAELIRLIAAAERPMAEVKALRKSS